VPTHLALGSSVGLSDEELSWLNGWQGAPAELFDASDRLTLRYAETLTRTVTVDDALWQELAARFSSTELFELCFTVGLAGLVNRMHATFHTDLDERTAQRVAQLDVPDDTVPDPRH
jgi:alkylhydroperoxidase family enzyme